ncbi:uncharacterized protein LOC132206235 [Stegostoma tigrinum]|uniref:uncharacterized protein LOC132206235 n=1 Tax=Stegostoma tigrinum TaxID=3053191 RepID=UPI00287061B0|nr:uncharacterized protein LOC132206235 [Stegostoma tigrinum]
MVDVRSGSVVYKVLEGATVPNKQVDHMKVANSQTVREQTMPFSQNICKCCRNLRVHTVRQVLQDLSGPGCETMASTLLSQPPPLELRSSSRRSVFDGTEFRAGEIVMNDNIIVLLKELLLSNGLGARTLFGTVLFLVLSGLEELLERQMPCPCTSLDSNHTYTGLFFGFPAVILLLISLLLQFELYQFRFCCERGSGNTGAHQETSIFERQCCFLVCKSLLLLWKILIPPILWISILLLDGDYYACAKIDITEVGNTTCAKFQCDRGLGSFLTGQRHHCDLSRQVPPTHLMIPHMRNRAKIQ